MIEGWPCGDSSQHSFAQCVASAHSTTVPASQDAWCSTRTRARSWKSPSGTVANANAAEPLTNSM